MNKALYYGDNPQILREYISDESIDIKSWEKMNRGFFSRLKKIKMQGPFKTSGTDKGRPLGDYRMSRSSFFENVEENKV